MKKSCAIVSFKKNKFRRHAYYTFKTWCQNKRLFYKYYVNSVKIYEASNVQCAVHF